MSAGRLPFVPCVRFGGLAFRSHLRASTLRRQLQVPPCSVKILLGTVNPTPVVQISKVPAEGKPGQIQVIGRLDQLPTEHFALRRVHPSPNTSTKHGLYVGSLRRWDSAEVGFTPTSIASALSLINTRVAPHTFNEAPHPISTPETRIFRSRHP